MRKHLISAVIGGLMGPIAGFCTATDIAAIRNSSVAQGAVADGLVGRRERKGAARQAGFGNNAVELPALVIETRVVSR